MPGGRAGDPGWEVGPPGPPGHPPAVADGRRPGLGPRHRRRRGPGTAAHSRRRPHGGGVRRRRRPGPVPKADGELVGGGPAVGRGVGQSPRSYGRGLSQAYANVARTVVFTSPSLDSTTRSIMPFFATLMAG